MYDKEQDKDIGDILPFLVEENTSSDLTKEEGIVVLVM